MGLFLWPKITCWFDLINFSNFCSVFLFVILFLIKNPKKMLFWLEHMQFDSENRCFNFLKLNQSDWKHFVKRMSLLFFTFNISVYSSIVFCNFKYHNCFYHPKISSFLLYHFNIDFYSTILHQFMLYLWASCCPISGQ